MKIEKMKCPGCGKHCPLSSPRCKFGRHYAEKMTEKLSPPLENKAKKKKWETWVTQGDLIWQFLNTSCLIKKALRDDKTTEEKLLSAFTAEEMITFSALLKKFDL